MFQSKETKAKERVVLKPITVEWLDWGEKLYTVYKENSDGNDAELLDETAAWNLGCGFYDNPRIMSSVKSQKLHDEVIIWLHLQCASVPGVMMRIKGL